MPQTAFPDAYIFSMTGTTSEGDALMHYLEDGGARAVRLFPALQNYALGETWCGTLLGTLEEAEVPVLIDLDQTDWREVDGVLAAHPRPHLVLLRVGYRINRWLYPLMSRYPGLRIEMHRINTPDGVKVLAEAAGAERVVFGSESPACAIASPLKMVRQAEISQADREGILGANLAALLGI